MAIENFTTYTEVDPNGYLTVSSDQVDFTSVPTSASSYVYKDFGANYFDRKIIDFQASATGQWIDAGNYGHVVLFALSNTIGTFQDMSNANDGIVIHTFRTQFAQTFRLQDFYNGDSDSVSIGTASAFDLRNYKFYIYDNRVVLKIYDSADYTEIVDTLIIDCQLSPKRYLYSFASRENSISGTFTGYTKNFEIKNYTTDKYIFDPYGDGLSTSKFHFSDDLKTITYADNTTTLYNSRTLKAKISGKWYTEFNIDNLVAATNSMSLGLGDSAHSLVNVVVGDANIGVGWQYAGGIKKDYGSIAAYAYTYTTGDLVMMAFDTATGEVWFGKNGSWNGTEDPANGLNPAYTETEFIGVSAFVLAGSGRDTNAIKIHTNNSEMVYAAPTGFEFLDGSSSSQSSSSLSSSFSSSSSSSSLSSSSSSSSNSNSSSSYSNIARIHFWHYVLNEEGQPIQNAEIRLYLQNAPTTEADIYVSEFTSSSTKCSLADIKTDNDGFFEFWLAGETATGGYAHTQEFILEWFKAGITPGYIYNYNPWPNALVWRDKNTGADRDYENKFISDALAKKWWDHAYAIVPSASPHDLHPVDFTSGCDDNTYNKVVSNKFLYDILQGCDAGDTFDLSTIYDGVIEHLETVTVWITAGDVYYIDINHPTVGNISSVKMVNLNTFEEVVPSDIINLSVTSTRVYIDTNIDANITIQGTSASSSSYSSSSSSSESSSSSSSSDSSSSSSSSLSSSSSSKSSSSTSFSLAFDSTFSLTTSDTDDTYWPFSGLNSGVYSYYTWLPSGGPDDSPCVEMSRYAYTSTFLSTKYIPASGFTHVNFDIDAKRNSTAIGSSYFPNIVVHQYDSGFGSLGVLTNPLYSGDFPSVNVWGDIIKSIAITNPSTAYIRAGFQSKLGAATGILLYLDNFNVSLSASSSSTSSSSSSSSTSVVNVSGAGLNPLDKNIGVALSNNNTTATAQITPTAPGAVRSVTYHTSGKYYFEASFDVLATSLTYYCSVGVMDNDSPLDTFIGNYDIAGVGVGWTQREGYVYQDAIGTDTGVTCSAGDIAMCAVDLDTGEVWFGKNGTWVDSGDPALGTTPTATETELIGVSAYSAVQVSLTGTGEEITIYLGASDMTYTIPNGFGAWG